MRKYKIIQRFICLALILAFMSGQVFAGQLSLSSSNSTVATPNVSSGIDKQTTRDVEERVADDAKPGAIANGPLLVALLDPNNPLPPRIEAAGEIEQALLNGIKLAHRILATGYEKIDEAQRAGALTAADATRLHETQTELLNFYLNFTKKLWLHHLRARGEEDYEAGFNQERVIDGGKVRVIGPALEVIERILAEYANNPVMAERLIAQYLTHECVSEKSVIIPPGTHFESLSREERDRLREDHRDVYQRLQTFLYGPGDVAALRKILRDSITTQLKPAPTPVDLTQLPPAFHENLERYGLRLERLGVVEVIDGKPRALAPGENPLQNSMRSQMIVGTTLLQALQASNYVGMAKALGMSADDFGKLADGAAVTVGRKALEFLAKAYDITIIIAGNEGKTRDGAPAMPLGYIINPGARNGTYLYIGDSIEVTNGVKGATNGSSSMMALFPVTVPFETDGYKISLWTNFPSVGVLNPVITGNNSLESILRRLAETRGLSLEQLAKQYDILTLDRHKNDELTAEARRLGFNVILKKDGDPVPAILRAIYGIPDANDKKLIVLSTGGANEHRMAQIIATLHGQSASSTTYGATAYLKAEDKKEPGSLRPAKDWTEKDLREFAEANGAIARVNADLGLNIPLLPQTPEELDRIEDEKTLAEQVKGRAAVGIASITGAPVSDAGVLKPYLPPVTYYNSADGRENVRVSGFFVNEEGRLFMYGVMLTSDDMARTRDAMIADNDYGLTPGIHRVLSQGSPVIQTETGQKYPIVQGMAAQSVEELLGNIKEAVRVTRDSAVITDRAKFINGTVDYLAHEAALSQNTDVKVSAQRILREAALTFNLKLGSINDFYMAKKAGKWANITVPAVNGRTDVYNQFQQLFRAAREKDVGALILELARSEMRYSAQDAAEFNAVSIAAAIKQGYEGLIFAQGDHYQVNKEKYDKGGADREKELKAIEDLIRSAVLAGKYNIDLDPSTLVNEAALKEILKLESGMVDMYLRDHPGLTENLDENGIKSVRRRLVDEIEMREVDFETEVVKRIEGLYKEMHKTTAEVTMRFIRYIRKLEKELGFPGGFHISVGIEERHIDNPEHKNNPSTVLGSATLIRIIMNDARQEGLVGPSKISLQTGTMHGVGGTVDFGIYQRHLKYRDRIGTAVFVQHGASTLEKQDFDKMKEGDVGEVHLATEYQKMELDVASRLLPGLGAEMAKYLSGMMEKDAKMKAKFGPMWELAFGNPEPAIAAIKADDVKREEKTALYNQLAAAQLATKKEKGDAAIINQIVGDTMPKGLKGTLKDLVKELPGPFKRQFMNLPAEVRAAVDKALYEEFSTILEKLGATDTRVIIQQILPFDAQPVIMPARPAALEKAVKAEEGYAKAAGKRSQGTTEMTEPQTEHETFDTIARELDGRADMFKQCLSGISAKVEIKRTGVLFFEKGIGENQSAKTARLYNVIRDMQNMRNPKTGDKLNVIVIEGTADEGKSQIDELRQAGKLDEDMVFVVGRERNRAALTGLKGKGWMALLDDSKEGDYEPIPEAAILLMMSSLNADAKTIADFHNEIAQNPISPAELQDLLNNRIVRILPKTTSFSERTNYQKKLYDLAAEALVRA